MEEEKIEMEDIEEKKRELIIGMKRCHKEANKALFIRCIDAFLSVVSAGAICYFLRDFLERRQINSILFGILALNSFMASAKRSKRNTYIINENLDVALRAEDLIESEDFKTL